MRNNLSLIASAVAAFILLLPFDLRSQSCNNWLYLAPGTNANVQLGDIDIPGQQVTVEAEFCRTTPYPASFQGGDLVSKHATSNNTNYLLRPNFAFITTDDGHFQVETDCPIRLNVTYHAAMVYDGSSLKYYRDGQMIGQVPAHGNLFQQDLPTRIGYFITNLDPENFEGYINEVRIWNVALTQAQIQANMNLSLTSPVTKPGLQAYYTFDNALNKQGNAAWNGILNNGPLLNQTNPYCNAPGAVVPGVTGTLTGSNTCNSAPGFLTFHSQIGAGPFTLQYTDGFTTYTESGVMDGIPFKLQVQPTESTTYTLVSVQDAPACPIPAVPGVTATVNPNLCTLCTGSLGDVVLDVTFGSGTGNSPPLETFLPGASTTLSYQPTSGNPASPTPQDGYYTISNNLPNNSNSSWFYGSKDHTGDVNGYMLFENPGFTTGEFFRQKVTPLCGGGKYEFAAWIANATDPSIAPNVILPDLTFIAQTEDGTVLATYNSGPIPELSSFVWHQYGFVFDLPADINTVIIRILDNNPGGTAVPGNDFVMDDITFRPCGPVMTASLSAGQSPSICSGASVTFTGSVSGGFANPAYLWQVSADGGTSWTDLPNSNNTLLTVTAPLTATPVDYHYRMLSAEAANIQSLACRVASNEVIVHVNARAATDFGFVQQACNPLQYQFDNTDFTATTYTWNVDGQDMVPVTAGYHTLLYTFPDYGNHVVTLTASSGICASSTARTIAATLQPAEILVTPDSNICAGKAVLLNTKAGLNFCWSPTTGLSDPTSSSPTATPAVTTKYHYTALVTGSNLVVNGDFSAGNTGFQSDYTYATNGFPAGMYGVGPNPAAWLPNAPACTDHTSETGNMLIVNGTQEPDLRVWSQTIVIQPNTNYAFSAWLENITTVNPASLQFSINGQRLGSPLTANVNDCIWDQFHTSWNSGTATMAILSIVNENTVLSGNDFALDDISFAPVTMETDSVTIDVETPVVTATPVTTSVCPGAPLQLQAGGSLNYSWSPATGLDDPNAANPNFVLPATQLSTTIAYTVTGTSTRGCTATASSTVTRMPQLIQLGPSDGSVCKGGWVRLYSSGGTVYNWSPADLLDDPASESPVATVQATTKFYLTISDLNLCSESDSLVINVIPEPTYKAPPDRTICAGFDVNLTSANGPGYVYAWSPADGLDDASSPVPDASPSLTTTYLVHISDSTCANYDSTFNVMVVVRPSPVITAVKDGDIDCAIHTSQLTASGGLSYVWYPAQGLNDPFSPSPIASVDTSTVYVVKGTGSNGCYAYDTLTVNVTATGANSFVVPNAFSPNGDGHNDCFGVTRWGDVRLQEMSVFNRFGIRVFTTRNPSECWDGTYHGQPQQTGAYVFVIRAHTFCGEFARTGTVMLVR